MSEYLDRSQVIDLYEKYHPRLATCVYEFGQELRKLPTVERPHGEWKPLGEPDELGIHLWHICSSCGFRTTWHMVDIFHFCPNCGADMRNRERKEKALENLASAKTVTDPSRRVEMVCDLIRKKED